MLWLCTDKAKSYGLEGRSPSTPNGLADLTWPWHAVLQHRALMTCPATASVIVLIIIFLIIELLTRPVSRAPFRVSHAIF
jgi:hypothetical protein